MAICVLCEENELAPRSKLPTCSNCRASMGLWARRPAAEVLNRRRKLHIYDLRMENVVLHPDPRKVRRMAPVIKRFMSASALTKKMKQDLKNGNGNGKQA